jgi:hypothetical protein
MNVPPPDSIVETIDRAVILIVRALGLEVAMLS